MTEMQRIMASAVGHNVEIHIIGGFKPCIGKCVGFTQPLDNEPEVASIVIDTGMRTSLTEIIEDEIESIKISD